MPDVELTPTVVQHLTRYRWPGNVRELENVLERMLVLSSSNRITEADLPEEIRRVPPDNSAFWIELPEGGVSLEAVERELILRALEQAKGNQTKAAKYLDISRRTLIYRMEKYGLAPERSGAEAGDDNQAS